MNDNSIDRTLDAESRQFAFPIELNDICDHFVPAPTPLDDRKNCYNCVHGDFGFMFFKTTDQKPEQGVCMYPVEK